MAETPSTAAAHVRAPWHLWVVGILALLWNAMGAFDYLMTETRNEKYLSHFSPDLLAYIESFPSWAIATWAIAVWGGVLGSLLLLVRKGWAVPVFAVSLLAMVATTVYQFALSDGYAIMGPGATAFAAVIFVVAVALLLYARAMRKRGVLA